MEEKPNLIDTNNQNIEIQVTLTDYTGGAKRVIVDYEGLLAPNRIRVHYEMERNSWVVEREEFVGIIDNRTVHEWKEVAVLDPHDDDEARELAGLL